jgi:hypothetical protein
MDYAALSAAVESSIGNTFAAADMARFAQFTEQKIYNAVQLPALRKNQTSSLSPGNAYMTLPGDYLYTYSLAAIEPLTGAYTYLLNKDVNYIREMFPDPAVQAIPRCYAQFDADTMLLGPVPDVVYAVELHYGYYPESIVTAGTTWLGDNFDSALLNGMLVEAARFIKEEADVVGLYDKLFIDAMSLLKQLGDGKLRQDTYRTPQVKDSVR